MTEKIFRIWKSEGKNPNFANCKIYWLLRITSPLFKEDVVISGRFDSVRLYLNELGDNGAHIAFKQEVAAAHLVKEGNQSPLETTCKYWEFLY